MSSVRVAVRARPLSTREIELGTPLSLEMRDKSTILHKSGLSGAKSTGRSMAKEFIFDHSYWSVSSSDDHYADQELIFHDLGEPVLQSAFEGYNACVFAYGQTGSGKTHTMMGTQSSAGLIPRICEGLYSRMAQGRADSADQVSYKTQVSYMEIYNEKVRDLLGAQPVGKIQHSLRVREHPKEGPYVEELSKHEVSDYDAISRLIELGNSHRATASTKMNDASSRSHAIFTIKFTQAKYHCNLPSETVSKIHLIDLAGSERASATGAEGDRLKEGGNINRSLVCLGTVISSLAEISSQKSHHKRPFIPYRDSVLTWLLKDSLGGNSKTIMIATISPAESSYGETLSTLRYSSRAKKIINRPTVNEDPNVKLIRELRAEIQRLKCVITSGGLNEGEVERPRLKTSESISLAEDIYKKEEQVAELTREWAAKWKDIKRIVEEHHLALRSEGVKMTVDSQRPHFVGVDPDILSTGLVFYYLRDGFTSIGLHSGSSVPDISVTGGDISTEHCQVEYKGHRVTVHPLGGDCFINHKRLRKPTKLSQGDLLQLGASAVFRFNNPHEAAKLRRRQSQGLLHATKSISTKSQREPTCSSATLPPSTTASTTATASPSSSSISTASSGRRGTLSSPPATSCTMTVELQSKERVSARGKRRTETSFMLNRSHHSEGEVELATDRERSATPSTELLLPIQEIKDVAPRRSMCFSLMVWLCAPLLLSVVSAFTFPAFAVLAILLLCMKMFGFSQRFRPLRWAGSSLTVLTAITVSPIAGICDLLCRMTFSVLTSLGIVRESCKLTQT